MESSPAARLVGVLATVLVLATATACSAGHHRLQSSTTPGSSTSAVGAGATSSAAASTEANPPLSSTTAATPTVSPAIAPVSAAAAAAGLVDVRTVIPDAIIDLRYATTSNFTSVALYPTGARCLVHQSMTAGLTAAADQLRSIGMQLVFWDCYRPHSVQVQMFQIVPDPNWVARPGPYATSHEAGRSVDVTLTYADASSTCPADQNEQGHCLLDMGTGFDDFTARAHAYATVGVSAAEQGNRMTLRAAMASGGLAVYSGEWWHFDGPGASTQRAQLDVPTPG